MSVGGAAFAREERVDDGARIALITACGDFLDNDGANVRTRRLGEAGGGLVVRDDGFNKGIARGFILGFAGLEQIVAGVNLRGQSESEDHRHKAQNNPLAPNVQDATVTLARYA